MGHIPTDVEFQPIETSRRGSVADVVQHLIENIASAGVDPGKKLPSERQLVEMLGVTRSTLRESLKTLALLGVIDIRQGDGTYLSETPSSFLPKIVSWGLLLDTAEARQLIEARQFLEIDLIELAATRITAEECQYCWQLLDRMRQASSPEEFAHYDSEFHLTIARSARNISLSSTLEHTKALLQAWVERVVIHSPGNDWVIEQHTQILEALEEQNKNTAVKAMERHMAEVTGRLLATLSSPGSSANKGK